MARLAFFFASQRHFDFLDCETETSKCFECERETFRLLKFEPTIKFTAEISGEKVTFLDTIVYKGKWFNSTSILDVRTFQNFPIYTFHVLPPIRGQEWLYKRRSAPVTQNFKFLKKNFQNRLEEFQKHLRERGYPRNLITLTLSEIHFENRKEALRQKPSREKTILPFVTQYQPSVPSLKNILMKHWQLIEKQPLLRQIYKEPPIISYKRGRSLKDILVKA